MKRLKGIQKSVRDAMGAGNLSESNWISWEQAVSQIKSPIGFYFSVSGLIIVEMSIAEFFGLEEPSSPLDELKLEIVVPKPTDTVPIEGAAAFFFALCRELLEHEIGEQLTYTKNGVDIKPFYPDHKLEKNFILTYDSLTEKWNVSKTDSLP